MTVLTKKISCIDASGQRVVHEVALSAQEQADYNARTAAAQVKTSEHVNVECARRVESAFSFNGHAFQFDAASKARITGFATLAGFAIQDGAQAGNLRWLDAGTDAGFIAADNTLVTMDAQTAFAFGQAAAAHERAHIFAARALKDMSSVPADYTDDQHWP